MNANEFGTNEDWIEIYNPQNIAVNLAADSWYISDNGQTNPYKYKLPALTIPAKGFLVIWDFDYPYEASMTKRSWQNGG